MPSEAALRSDAEGRAVVLRKHVDAVHVVSALTRAEKHAANVLLANAMRHAGPEGINANHEIYLPDLVEAIGDNRKNRVRIRRVLNGLLRKRVQWAYTDARSREVWGATAWLAGYDVVDRTLYYSYSPQLAQRILKPAIFARLNMSVQNRLTFNHSQTLYENCVRYRGRVGRTKIWDIETFRNLMGVGEAAAYRQYKELNRRVIKPAVVAINQHTEIEVEPVLYTRGKTVRSIGFLVRENESYRGPAMPLPEQVSAKVDTEVLTERSDCFEALLTFGIEPSYAAKLLGEYDDDHLLGNLALVAQRLRAPDGKKRVANIGGYAINAIRKNYLADQADHQACMDFSTPEERENKERAAARQSAAAALASFERDYKRWRVERWLAATHQETVTAHLEDCRDAVVARVPMMARMLNEDPAKSGCARAMWHQYVVNEILPKPSDAERALCARELDFPLDERTASAGEAPAAS